MEWYTKVLTNYVGFSGRARRKEYWFFTLVNVAVVFVLAVIDQWLGLNGLLVGLYTLAVFLPSLAVGVRRLHDTDRSGWWMLISLVPFIGSIVLLVFMLLEGTLGQNRYGPSPKSGAAVPATA